MTAAIEYRGGLLLAPSSDRGMSDDARAVRCLAHPKQGSSPRIALGYHQEAALENLKAAVLESTMDGWDGYKAKPVDAAAFVNAVRFISYLSVSVPVPEIAIDADGDVALDWERGPSRLFSVRISRDGTLYYAGLVGNATFHGTEYLRESVPSAIGLGIERAVSGY